MGTSPRRSPGRIVPGEAFPGINSCVSEQLNEFLAERASGVVRGNFTGVGAEWWWERRMGGGVEVCQELDPRAMIQEIAANTGRDPSEVRRIVEEELGLEDLDPVVLTFEISGEATEDEAAMLLRERSRSPQGLAAGAYERVEQALEN